MLFFFKMFSEKQGRYTMCVGEMFHWPADLDLMFAVQYENKFLTNIHQYTGKNVFEA